MKPWQIALVVVAAAIIAFRVGYSSGTRDCPEHIAYKAQQDAESARFMAEIMAEPTGREAVCDQIFDLVEDEIALDIFLEQQELSDRSVDYRD